MHKTDLRFNFGYLIEASPGTQSRIEFDYPKMRVEEITFEPLSADFQVIRTSEGLYITGHFQTNYPTECVRCLDSTIYPLVGKMDELYYYPPSLAPEGVYVLGEDGFIDLGPLIRELSVLELPMQPLCSSDCLGLCIECGENLNYGECGCDRDNIDPRLAGLKALLSSDDD